MMHNSDTKKAFIYISGHKNTFKRPPYIWDGSKKG